MSKLNNEIECPYYQHAVVNEDGDDFYDLCYGEEKGEYCCDEENKNCLYRQLQQLKATLDDIEELIDTCNNTRYCKDCKFTENCKFGKGWSWKKMVLQKIKEVKE